MTSHILSNALFTKTQQRVLGLLYGAPGKSFYTNEILRIAAVGRGTVIIIYAWSIIKRIFR